MIPIEELEAAFIGGAIGGLLGVLGTLIAFVLWTSEIGGMARKTRRRTNPWSKEILSQKDIGRRA